MGRAYIRNLRERGAARTCGLWIGGDCFALSVKAKERLVPLPEATLRASSAMETHKNPRWLFPTRAATNPIGRGTLVPLSAQAAGIGSG
jgi:hypothetical protein